MSVPTPVRVLSVRGHASFARLRTAPAQRARALRVRYAPSGTDEVRVAYQIGRHFGNAVLRNRARRRLRAVVAGFSNQLQAGDYLVIPQPTVLTMPFTDLTDALTDAMSHAVDAQRDASPGGSRP